MARPPRRPEERRDTPDSGTMPRTDTLPTAARVMLLERAVKDLEKSIGRWHGEQLTAMSEQSSALKGLSARIGELETDREVEERLKKERERDQSNPWGGIPTYVRRDRTDPISLTPSMIEQAGEDARLMRVLATRKRAIGWTAGLGGGIPVLIALWEFIIKRFLLPGG